MQKATVSLPEICEKIKSLKGESVKMHINRGRKRIEKYTGVIESVYPSIFTVKLDDPIAQESLSYSYNDVLCGDVKVVPNKKA